MEVQDISVIQKKPMPLGTYWKLLWIFSWDRSNLELNGSQLMKQAHVHQDTDIMSQQQADSGYPMFPLKFGVHWFSEFSSGKSQFGFYTSWILQYGFLFYVYTPKSSVVRKVTGKCAWVISQCNFHFFFFCSCCSVTKLCLTLCSSMGCSMTGFPVLHYFLEFAETHVHWICDAIQPSHLPLPSSSPALSLSQHQSLFKRVCT